MKKRRDFILPNKTKWHLFLSFSGTAVETTWTNEKKRMPFSPPNKTKPRAKASCDALIAPQSLTAALNALD